VYLTVVPSQQRIYVLKISRAILIDIIHRIIYEECVLKNELLDDPFPL
jgi:hypothetical protein